MFKITLVIFLYVQKIYGVGTLKRGIYTGRLAGRLAGRVAGRLADWPLDKSGDGPDRLVGRQRIRQTDIQVG